MNKKHLYLIDGYALIYRAYFALLKHPLSNSKGIPTGAFYGFAGYLLRLLELYDCPYIAVVMDSAKPTFRHILYDKYKANRAVMPEELRAQIPYIRQFIDACNIPTVIQEGLEADDLIATLTIKAVEAGFDVYLVTKDKDLMQLVGPHVTMLAPEGAGVLEPLGTPEVEEKMGVAPHRVIDYLSLIGDASDNIPGVPGIGPKTALKILSQVASVEELLADTSVIANPKLRQKIDENRELLILSKRLVTLKTDSPIVFSLDELSRRPFNINACDTLIREMECMSLLKNSVFSCQTSLQKKESITVIDSVTHLETLLDAVKNRDTVALVSFTTDHSIVAIDLQGYALAINESEAFFLPLNNHQDTALPNDILLSKITDLLQSVSVKKICHNLKHELHAAAQAGITLRGDIFDCMIAAYLLDPGKREYSITALAAQWLHTSLPSIESKGDNEKKRQSGESGTLTQTAEVCSRLACALLTLEKRFRPLLHEKNLWNLFVNIEIPLAGVLTRMEREGIKIDTIYLAHLSHEYRHRLGMIQSDLYMMAGEEFNINSPKQIGEVLFEKMHLPAPKRTKTGAHATGVEILENLATSYPIAQRILDYRELQKLLSTYIDALPTQIMPQTARVHTTFNQTIAATGRLSSTDPNLQNIPIRSEDGKRIRDAFIPSDGAVICSADYSQIELRILAHLSRDPLLMQAFAEDKDIHTQTASAIYGIFPEMVTSEMRRAAKTINFGLMYGMGPVNLARQIGISFAEARVFIETYFHQFPTIRNFMETTISFARKNGYVETLYGRRRYLPEINTSNRVLREAAERTAINTPVQGTAADIIKIAMISIAEALPAVFPHAKMVLQVHDELVFEIPEEDATSFRDWVVHLMSNAYTLSVPLKVEAKIGKNWNEAH